MTTYELGFDIHGPLGAPVVVLGSSLGTTRAMWDAVLPVLAERFRVLRYDHLGHGESDVPSGPYSMEGLADALAEMLAVHGVDHAHVAGASLGGMVGLQLAATKPHLVDRLAIVCSSAYLPPAQTWLDRAAAVRSGGIPAVADAVLRRWFTPRFSETAVAAAVRDDLLATPPEGYAGCCEAIAAMDLRPRLGSIRAPTLAIAGADDAATPVEHAHVVADGVRVGRAPACVEVVSGAAHLAGVERPDEVWRLLVEHFTRSI